MQSRLKNTISRLKENPKTPFFLVAAVLLLHFFCLEAVWIYIDSFVFLKVNFNFLVPQHAPLYPGLIHILKIFLKSDLTLFWVLKIVQNLVLLLSLFYLLKNVYRKLLIALLICAFFPIFIIQNGLFSESFNVSCCIFFLTSCYKLYTLRQLSISDLFIHFLSLMGLMLTRHVGILFILLPILILLNYKHFKLNLKIQLVSIQLVALCGLFFSNQFIRSHFDIIDSPMYGRPAMHIIDQAVNQNRSTTSGFQKKWFNKAQSKEELMAQQIILSDTNVWLSARMNIYDSLKVLHPHWSLKQIDLRTESLLNKAYYNFATTGDWVVFKQYFKTSARLIFSTYTAYSVIHNDFGTKHSDLYKTYELQELQHLKPDYSFSFRSCWILIFILADTSLSLFILYMIISSATRKRLNEFEKKLLLFYFLQISVHAVFTVFIARYTIMLNLMLLFVVVSILENRKHSSTKFLTGLSDKKNT